MNAETLQVLKTIYTNDKQPTCILDTAGNPLWKNDADGIFRDASDYQKLLKLLQVKESGTYHFWHHSVLYAAVIRFYPELDGILISISEKPVLSDLIEDSNVKDLCQQILASKRQSICGITMAVEQIYDKVEACEDADALEMEQDDIFSQLNIIMYSCCRLMQDMVYYEELNKYNELLSTEAQPLCLATVFRVLKEKTADMLRHSANLNIPPITAQWVYCNENRLCFCLLSMLSCLLRSQQHEIQEVYLHVHSDAQHVTMKMETQSDQPVLPLLLKEPPMHHPNSQYPLMMSMINRFCREYDAQFSIMSEEETISYQLKMPLYYQSPSKLQAERSKHVSISTPDHYQILLCDASNYRFY